MLCEYVIKCEYCHSGQLYNELRAHEQFCKNNWVKCRNSLCKNKFKRHEGAETCSQQCEMTARFSKILECKQESTILNELQEVLKTMPKKQEAISESQKQQLCIQLPNTVVKSPICNRNSQLKFSQIDLTKISQHTVKQSGTRQSKLNQNISMKKDSQHSFKRQYSVSTLSSSKTYIDKMISLNDEC